LEISKDKYHLQFKHLQFTIALGVIDSYLLSALLFDFDRKVIKWKI